MSATQTPLRDRLAHALPYVVLAAIFAAVAVGAIAVDGQHTDRLTATEQHLVAAEQQITALELQLEQRADQLDQCRAALHQADAAMVAYDRYTRGLLAEHDRRSGELPDGWPEWAAAINTSYPQYAELGTDCRHEPTALAVGEVAAR